MAEKTSKTIRIKWVRSGIAFTRRQKTIVRSLGLYKLNHTVVRLDTPQIRGIINAVPHMLAIVPEPVAPAWALIPEYTIHPSALAAATTAETATEAPAPAAESTADAAEASKPKAPRARKKKASAPEAGETA